MKKNIKRLLFSFLLFIITYFSITWAKNNREWVEFYYAQAFYPTFSSSISRIFGWMPFLAGEIILISLCIFCLYIFFSFIKKPSVRLLIDRFTRLTIVIAVIYLLFWSFWGINNFRLPLETHLDYDIETLSVVDLEKTARYLIEEIKVLEQQMSIDNQGLPIFMADTEDILNKSKKYFDDYSERYAFLASGYYSPPKAMLFSEVMSHLNYTGIYNPFTVEPNVNVSIPHYKVPFVATHEIAHQRGIAGEREANFIAFVVSYESGDPQFMYSACLNGLIYITNALYAADKDVYSEVRKEFTTSLVAVFSHNASYWERYDTAVADIGEKNNNRFLKATGQSEGTKSYGLVVDFIVAYVKEMRKD
jgi:hypothetical protein